MSDKLVDGDVWKIDWRVQSQVVIDSSDWWDKRWKYRMLIKVRGERVDRDEITWRLLLDPVKFMKKVGLDGEFDPNSVRVVSPSGELLSSAFYYDPYFFSWKGIGWTLVWNSEGKVKRDEERIYYVYFDTLSNGPKPPASKSSAILVNAIKNSDFKEGLRSGWTILNGTELVSVGSFPEVESDLTDRVGLKLDVNADNIRAVGEEPVTLNQKVDASNLAGKKVLFSCSLYLEKGKGGCPVQVNLISYDSTGAICGEEVLSAFTLAERQLVRLNAPGEVPENVVAAQISIQLSPIMKEQSEYGVWKQVIDCDAHLCLNLTDVRLRPGVDVEFPNGVKSPYKKGRFPNAPVNLGVEFTGQRMLMFNTYPKKKGSNGAGEPVRFNIWRGTLECWLKPYWNYDDGVEHAIFWGGPGWGRHPYEEGRSGKGVNFVITKRGKERDNRLEISFSSDGEKEHSAWAVVEFKRDMLYHITATWELNEGKMALFVNGKKVASVEEGRQWLVAGIPEILEVGNRSGASISEWSSRTLNGIIDELRISDCLRYDEDFIPSDEEFELDEFTCSPG